MGNIITIIILGVIYVGILTTALVLEKSERVMELVERWVDKT